MFLSAQWKEPNTALVHPKIDVIGNDCSVEDTAISLAISPDTIKGYMKWIFARLEVSNRVELTLEAIRLGIIESCWQGWRVRLALL